MKHNIRINGQVKEIDCELGSGLLDDNDREIFEGDIAKVVFDDDDTDAGKSCLSSRAILAFRPRMERRALWLHRHRH